MKTSTKRYFRTIIKHIIIWTIAFAVFTFIREYGQVITHPVEEFGGMSWDQRLIFQLMIGVVSGILFGSYAYLFEKKLARRFSFGKTILIGGIGYAFLILFFIRIAFFSTMNLLDLDVGVETLVYFYQSGQATVIIFFCFLVGFIIDFVEQINRKLGPGNLVKMLTGEFYNPKEEERIFMFLDMRSSTTIAEQLGHIKYSQLLQDCFKDIEVVMPFKAEIYQYVGDEAVLTWKQDTGLKDANCVLAFFAFANRLRQRQDYYQSKYGLVPEFKAGMNLGRVTVAEVGEIKSEIAYHGDTINTAARIQSKCNEYEKNLLASERVIIALKQIKNISAELVGKTILRGKKEEVNIHALQVL